MFGFGMKTELAQVRLENSKLLAEHATQQARIQQL